MTFLSSMLGDGSGEISSKRTITFLAFLMCCTAFISNLFWNMTMDATIYQSMMYIVIGGLGFTVTEAFASKK
jgi:hypothetical protein